MVVDRLTHWYHTSREWIKKAVVLNDLYVYNNPWSIQSNEKHTTYCAMMRLGLPIPETWMVPPKSYDKTADLEPTLQRYAQLFDLGAVGKKLGYPLFMKPYDGGGWKGVTKIDNDAALKAAYEASGTDVMHLQAGIIPFDRFVRCIGLGPQTRVINYDPAAALHDRYRMDRDFISSSEQRMLEDITLTINTFFGWDFNSCEALLKNHAWYPIDFANACPDSQVTSLHYHFPWLVKANLRWAIFCAATQRQDAQEPRLGAVLRRSRRAISHTRKADGYARIASGPACGRRVRGFLRQAPGASRRRRRRVFRHGGGQGRGAPQGRGAVPGARVGFLHGAVLLAHPGLAQAGRPRLGPVERRVGQRLEERAQLALLSGC